MATLTKFQPFVENLCEGKFNFGSDATCTLTAAFSAGAPTASWGTLSQCTLITMTNMDSRVLAVSSSAQASGTYTLKVTDKVITATGTVPTFRYIIVYDDDAASDELIGYYDYGSNVDLLINDTFTLNFDETNGVFQLT